MSCGIGYALSKSKKVENQQKMIIFSSSQLKAARVGLNLSQKEVAQDLDIAVGTLNRLEKGAENHPIAPGTVMRLAAYLMAKGAHLEPDGKSLRFSESGREFDVSTVPREQMIGILAFAVAAGAAPADLEKLVPGGLGGREAMFAALEHRRSGASRRQFEKLMGTAGQKAKVVDRLRKAFLDDSEAPDGLPLIKPMSDAEVRQALPNGSPTAEEHPGEDPVYRPVRKP